jgi:hypothetical protein
VSLSVPCPAPCIQNCSRSLEKKKTAGAHRRRRLSNYILSGDENLPVVTIDGLGAEAVIDPDAFRPSLHEVPCAMTAGRVLKLFYAALGSFFAARVAFALAGAARCAFDFVTRYGMPSLFRNCGLSFKAMRASLRNSMYQAFSSFNAVP